MIESHSQSLTNGDMKAATTGQIDTSSKQLLKHLPSRFNLSSGKYTLCVKCFNSIESESIFVGDDPTQALVEIPKKLFLLAKNDIQEPEIMIDCIICTRRWHQICALRLDQIWPEGFICNTCIREYNIKRKENRYIAQQLTVTDLSSRLEERVNKFLFDKDCHEGRVTIRVLASCDKICKVKSQLKIFYRNQVVDGYPYRKKAIFAFQEIEGVDIVFFGIYVQEYDERCPAPNTHRVYISYLDTVHFFRPKLYRQDVYHEILIGYLDYAKQHGYMYAHLWACPTREDFDYIFHCHPPEQRLPKLKHLRDWCRKMLDRAIAEHIAIDYKNIMQDCLDNQVYTVLDIPYFDDDLWPIIIEDSIEKLNQEDPTEISGKRKSANTYEKKLLKKMANQMSNCTDLLSIIFSTMEKRKEFDIRYYCTVCDDFDLCKKCYNVEPKYEHKMECSVLLTVDMSQDNEQNLLNSNDKSIASTLL
ncbi:unnamed protein product [Rotaria sp. Silwood2]|nr:unnamed protein product [Rotaria sp. Silwood2]